jgi:hypothetical protein
VPADGKRDIPDVSLFASDGPQSKSFYPLCQADAIKPGSAPSCVPDSTGHFSFFGSGGTSASSPAFAGIMALINQSQANAGKPGRQGNANFVLYKIAQTATNSCNSSSRTDPTVPAPAGCVFNDVTKGSNSVPCAGNSPNCSSQIANTNGVLVSTSSPTTPAWTTTTGYDLATGLGSVNVTNLAAAWTSTVGAFKASTTTLNINGSTAPPAIPHGTAVTAAVTVTSGSGTPTGDVSLVGPSGTVNGGIGDATLSGGAVNITNVILPGGSYKVTAHYAGDGTFAPSDSTGVPVVVNKENSRLQYGIVTFGSNGAITSTNATSVVYGSPYILRIEILNSSANACQPLVTGGTKTGCAFDATGTVTITDSVNGATSVPLDTGTFVINSAGHAEDQPIQLAPGTHALSATYSGDISYNAIGPIPDTVTVTKAATATTVAAAPSTGVTTTTSVTLTAKVTTNSNGAGPTGTVQFKSGSSALSSPVACTPTAATNTTAPFCTATLPTTLSFIVPPQTPRFFPNSPVSPIWIATYSLLLLILLALAGWPRTKKRVYVFASLIVFAIVVSGIAGCGSGVSGPHTDNITAVYSGDANYVGSTSPAVPISVR